MAKLKQMAAFRLDQDTLAQIEELAGVLDRPKTWVVERAVDAFYERHRRAGRVGKDIAPDRAGA